MGRSRGVSNSTDEDGNQRSKRRRVASGGENLETSNTGPGTSEGKKALYHCNYCNKDISGKIRIKCTKCPDFDLCVECFSVGAEVTPHKSNHPYRVMIWDNSTRGTTAGFRILTGPSNLAVNHSNSSRNITSSASDDLLLFS